MKATAQRTRRTSFTHTVEIRHHRLVADEPIEQGGDDEGPTPQELLAASLASCTAMTLEMYAERKGWDLGIVEVEVEYELPERGGQTKFSLEVRLPTGCTPEQIERLQVIASKCPVHRILEGEAIFTDRIKLVSPASSEPGGRI
jgi:putative redox protein